MCSRVLIKSCSLNQECGSLLYYPSCYLEVLQEIDFIDGKPAARDSIFRSISLGGNTALGKGLTDLSVSPLTERILVFPPSMSVCALFLSKKNPFKVQVSPS